MPAFLLSQSNLSFLTNLAEHIFPEQTELIIEMDMRMDLDIFIIVQVGCVSEEWWLDAPQLVGSRKDGDLSIIHVVIVMTTTRLIIAGIRGRTKMLDFTAMAARDWRG